MRSKKDMLDRKKEKRAEAMRQSLMKRKAQIRERKKDKQYENQNGNDKNGTD